MRKILILLYKIKIFKRIIPSVLKIIIKFNKNKFTVIKYNNFLLNLNLNNPIDREIYLKNEYELNSIKHLDNTIKKENISFFLDIGSHMGFYSMFIARNPGVNVYAFEPIEDNYNQLSENIRINNYNNIKKYNLALSDYKGKALMWVTNKKKTGGYSIFNENDVELKKYNERKIYKTSVLTDKGDNILKIENKKIAVKIDVERHEKLVLEGIKDLIKKNKIFLQIEIFDHLYQEIDSLLTKYNFQYLSKEGKDFFYKNY
tara:strand:+ start:197 stop:973 length:777 start_codon:yes stop_codon:yes gene_type:complete